MGLAMFLIKVNKSWPSVVRAPTHPLYLKGPKVRSDVIQATVKRILTRTDVVMGIFQARSAPLGGHFQPQFESSIHPGDTQLRRTESAQQHRATTKTQTLSTNSLIHSDVSRINTRVGISLDLGENCSCQLRSQINIHCWVIQPNSIFATAVLQLDSQSPSRVGLSDPTTPS